MQMLDAVRGLGDLRQLLTETDIANAGARLLKSARRVSHTTSESSDEEDEMAGSVSDIQVEYSTVGEQFK